MRLGHLSGPQLTEYLDGEMPPLRAARAERHLSACERCRKALAELRQTVWATEAVRPVAAPAEVRQRVAARLAGERVAELTCGAAGPLLHEHVDGQLSPALVGAVQRHIRTCVRCRAELVVLTKVAGVLRSLQALTPPTAIRESVAAARRALPALPDRVAARWRTRLRPALGLAVVAASVLLLFLARPSPRATQVAVGPPSVPAGRPLPSLAGTAAEGVITRSPAPLPTGEAAGVSRAEETAAPEAGARGEPVVDFEGPAGRPTYAGERGFSATHGPWPEPVAGVPSRGGDYERRSTAGAPGPSVPSAVLTLREIARDAGGDSGGHRGMTAIGERFATLDWEAALATPPQAKPPAPTGRTSGPSAREGTSEERPGEAGPGSGSDDGRAHGAGLRAPLV